MKVFELSEGWSASAVAGRLLADLGADVVKLEPPAGDPVRRLGPLHAGGESLLSASLLLGKTCHRDPSRVDAEAAAAGIVLIDEVWRRRLGLTEADWRGRHPHAVTVVASAFGAGSDRHGSELVLQAVGGVTALNGHPDSAPSRAGIPLATSIGALLGAGAALAALRRGRGAWIDIAGYDAMVMMQGNFLPAFFHSGRVPERVGNVQLLSAPWNTYPTLDGEIVIVAISENLWHRLLRVIGRPDLIGDERYRGKPNRVRRRAEVDGLIADWTSRRSSAEVAAVLDEARVAVGRVRSIPQVLAASDLTGTTTVGGHEVPVWKPFFRIEDRAARPAPVPPVDRPLAGVRVLELGGHTAAGLCTRMLADLGADVVKVELRQGDNARDTAPVLSDGSAYLWHFWNVGKRSAVVDVGDPRGRDVLLRLVAASDVFVENMAPDTVEKLRVTDADLRAANPGLIYCAISGFGWSGPAKYRRAFDVVLQAEAGIMSVTGEAGGQPVKTGPSVVDNTVALASFTAIAAALHRGRGAFIDMALFNTAAWLTTEWWPVAWAGGEPRPMGNGHPYHAVHDIYRSADGRWVALSGFWDDDPAGWVAGRTAADAVRICQAKGVAAGIVNDLPEVLADPATAEREMLLDIPIEPDGSCRVIGSPFKFGAEGTLLAARRRVPGLGEHTGAVLREAGFTDDEIAALREAEVTVPERKGKP
jgi:crotonobetainyl-CoA:carnitine CoA-transferase CaiB-like acyl-CoA transferase